jgi:hypothetical protein
MTTVYKFKTGFTKLGKVENPIYAPSIKVRDTDLDTLLVDGDLVSVSNVISGACDYSYTGSDNLDLEGLFHTDDVTVDQQDLYSYTPKQITVTQIDTQLSSTHGSGSWNSSSQGSGSITYVYTVTDSVTSSPLGDVKVTVFTDLSLINEIASGSTNAFGIVTFYLDPGTYYFVCKKSGFNFNNPDLEVVV